MAAVQWWIMGSIVLASINAKWIHPSLALRLLKANLGELESCCRIIEFALRQPLEEKISVLLEARPRILGVSVSIWNHKATTELLEAFLAALARRRETPPVIILGGPEVSYISKESALFRQANYVVRGEGEKIFRELCRCILVHPEPPAETPEKIDKPGSSARFIDEEPVDLAAIDSGYRLYTAEDLDRKLIYVESSRGCPFRCAFCQSSIETAVREFPQDRFLGDMEKLLTRNHPPEWEGGLPPWINKPDQGFRTFKFLDRSCNVNIPRTIRIMEFFLDNLKTSPPFQVHFEMVPGNFPQELLETLARFPPGTLRLEIGIQTLNPNTAALIRRPSNPLLELENIHALRQKTAAVIHADLIAALPEENLNSFGEGFDRLWMALTREPADKKAPAFEIQLGILKGLPGTELALNAAHYGLVFQKEPPYEIQESSVLSAKDLERIKNYARFWELIVNRLPFPDLAPLITPPGEPVFFRFMALADRLYQRFGKNWGIAKDALRTELLLITA